MKRVLLRYEFALAIFLINSVPPIYRRLYIYKHWIDQREAITGYCIYRFVFWKNVMVYQSPLYPYKFSTDFIKPIIKNEFVRIK